jgi:hypothetical protein
MPADHETQPVHGVKRLHRKRNFTAPAGRRGRYLNTAINIIAGFLIVFQLGIPFRRR